MLFPVYLVNNARRAGIEPANAQIMRLSNCRRSCALLPPPVVSPRRAEGAVSDFARCFLLREAGNRTRQNLSPRHRPGLAAETAVNPIEEKDESHDVFLKLQRLTQHLRRFWAGGRPTSSSIERSAALYACSIAARSSFPARRTIIRGGGNHNRPYLNR